MNAVDGALVADVTSAVRERLAEASGGRGAAGGGRGAAGGGRGAASAGRAPHARLTVDDERQLARRLIAAELDRVAESRLAAGLDPIALDAEHDLADAVLANTMGLGRLQPHLDDPEVQDIHVRGSESTWLKLRDGRRRSAPPVVDSDDELVDLVRLVATRMGRAERRFDAAAPELNVQLPDGSRLFAVMDVSTRPSVIVRKHLFSLSSLAELCDRQMLDAELRSFLTAAVRARRNLIITGGTGSGKTTL